MLQRNAIYEESFAEARADEQLENHKQHDRLQSVFGSLDIDTFPIFEQMSADLDKIEGRVK